MPRRYRYRRAGRRSRYSVERKFLTNTVGETSTSFVIVPVLGTEGLRKAKNFQIQFACAQDVNVRILWALVYVPAGTSAGVLAPASPSNSVYEPNQFVIMSGVYDTTSPGNTSRQFTRLSRNLHSGDFIALVMLPSASVQISTWVQYAIKYN